MSCVVVRCWNGRNAGREAERAWPRNAAPVHPELQLKCHVARKRELLMDPNLILFVRPSRRLIIALQCLNMAMSTPLHQHVTLKLTNKARKTNSRK